MDLIRNSKLKNGFMKLWLYQFYALSHLSWPLMIHDLDMSFARDLQAQIQPTLKKWAGIARSADSGLLFRAKTNFGLGITPISDFYQRMQLVKCELLRNSTDPNVQKLYETRQTRNQSVRRVWKATNLATTVNAEVDLDLKFPAQESHKGLGFGNFNPNPSQKDRRKLVIKKAVSFFEEARIIHSHSLKQQSAWLQWSEFTEPFDFSWKNLIWGGLSFDIIKFILAASINWVRTPVLLHLWGYKNTCYCCLCGAQKCTIHHILSSCNFALNNGRYTWRHDSVLCHIFQAFKEHVDLENQKKSTKSSPDFINFIKAGTTPQLNQKFSKKNSKSHLLSKATDWNLLVDLPGHNYVFPAEIWSTSERPDIVLWSITLHQAILIELTCPAEEGIQAAVVRKQSKYTPLAEDISRDTQWKVELLTIEVGARGFIATSTRSVFAKLGLPAKKLNSLCKLLSVTAATCSFAIYQAANSKFWEKNRPLI